MCTFFTGMLVNLKIKAVKVEFMNLKVAHYYYFKTVEQSLSGSLSSSPMHCSLIMECKIWPCETSFTAQRTIDSPQIGTKSKWKRSALLFSIEVMVKSYQAYKDSWATVVAEESWQPGRLLSKQRGLTCNGTINCCVYYHINKKLQKKKIKSEYSIFATICTSKNFPLYGSTFLHSHTLIHIDYECRGCICV